MLFIKFFVEKSLNEYVKKWGILKENIVCWDKIYFDRCVFYCCLVFIDELYWREIILYYIYKGCGMLIVFMCSILIVNMDFSSW